MKRCAKSCRHFDAVQSWDSDGYGHTRQRAICPSCRSMLPLGASNDKPGIVRVEIAAAGLIAGYLTANDTDVTLNDPIARMVLDWQLEEHGPMLEAVALCDALYGVAVNDRDQARGAA